MIEPPVCSLLRFPVATQIVASKIISAFDMTVSCASLKGIMTPVTSGLEYTIKLTYTLANVCVCVCVCVLGGGGGGGGGGCGVGFCSFR